MSGRLPHTLGWVLPSGFCRPFIVADQSIQVENSDSAGGSDLVLELFFELHCLPPALCAAGVDYCVSQR